MNLQNLVRGLPQSYLDALRCVNTDEWVAFESDDEHATSFRVDPNKVTNPTGRQLIEQVKKVVQAENSAMASLWIFSLQQLAQKGPKLFRPTLEQCEAMEHVEIRLPISDYRQPYPTMAIQFPTEYYQSLVKRSGFQGQRAPQLVIVHHFQERKAVFTGAQTVGANGLPAELTYFFKERNKFPTIEHALRTHINQQEPGEEFISEAMTRVAMNLCLLLMEQPHRLVPSDPRTLTKAKENINRLGKEVVNRREVATHVHLVCPDQEIVVRQVRDERHERTETGVSPKPHWRRGHWRRERGYRDVIAAGGVPRRVFVRPCFVRSGEYDGGLGTTSATYTIR